MAVILIFSVYSEGCYFVRFTVFNYSYSSMLNAGINRFFKQSFNFFRRRTRRYIVILGLSSEKLVPYASADDISFISGAVSGDSANSKSFGIFLCYQKMLYLCSWLCYDAFTCGAIISNDTVGLKG